jgi:MSHA pilin protein MshA
MRRIKNNQSGFTLIELVMVIVILGILAVTALPKFVDLSGEALTASKAGMSGGVKSAHSVLVASNAAKGAATINPTVTELAAAITPAGTADVTGVKVKINGEDYIVPTFKNETCTTPTDATDPVVLCVGDIP